jgi:hypothetical protein
LVDAHTIAPPNGAAQSALTRIAWRPERGQVGLFGAIEILGGPMGKPGCCRKHLNRRWAMACSGSIARTGWMLQRS